MWIRVDEEVQMESVTCTTTDLSTQTAPTSTADTVTQMEPTMSRHDAGMSTEPPSICETGIQANETPTSPSSPPSLATSPIATAPLAPSTTPTSSTTTTTTPSPAPEQPPAPQRRWHTLPSRLSPPLQHPKPPLLSPEHCCFAATSSSSTAPTATTTTTMTATGLMSSTQKAPLTPDIHHQAVNDALTLSTAQQTPLHDRAWMCLSEHVCCSMDNLPQPHRPK